MIASPNQLVRGIEQGLEFDNLSVLQGGDALALYVAVRDAIEHFRSPLSAENHDAERKFVRLAERWRRETLYSSSTHDIVMHPAYQQIIGMGEEVVPILIGELRASPDHWFWALRAITGIDPVDPKDRGDIEKMAASWVRWGERNGYA